MLYLLHRPKEDGQEIQEEKTESKELTEVLWYYPTNIILGEQLTQSCFTDELGEAYSTNHFYGHYTVVTYWASWCSYCEKQMEVFKEAVPKLQDEEVKFLLVNKLDGEKETKEQAQEYLINNEIPIDTVYDDGLTIYEELGIQIVPTTMILNPEGKLVYCYSGVIESEGQLQAMLDYARFGGGVATKEFVLNSLMSSDGGIYTNYKDRKGEAPTGHDILSESQGLMMEYAALTKNPELFRKTFTYVKEHLYEKNLATWVETDKGKAHTNALLDDLRILKALNLMKNTVGGYEEEYNQLAEAILLYNTKKEKMVDFYNFSTKERAARFTLCYGDFVAMKLLEEEFPHMNQLVEDTMELVSNGYISDEFPFYHNYYDYKEKAYDDGSLNMAEAMYTLYHLGEVGELKQASIDWLKKQMKGNGIWARYDTNGEVVSGYEYQSSAIYALVGLIAVEIEDKELLTMAVSRMEASRCFDADDSLNGAFAKQLDDVMSYDQCLALLLYAKMELFLEK